MRLRVNLNLSADHDFIATQEVIVLTEACSIKVVEAY